jgi:SAM-dependent methyltransferase
MTHGEITGERKFPIVWDMIHRYYYLKKFKLLDIGGTKESYDIFHNHFLDAEIVTLNNCKGDLKGCPNPICENIKNSNRKLFLKFDVVFAGDILEHLDSPKELFFNTQHYLKPKGIAILTTPNLASWQNRLFLLFGKPLLNYCPADMKYGLKGHSVGHKLLFTLKGLKELLQDNGFETELEEGFTYANKKSKFSSIRIFIDSILPTSWKEGLVILARR